MNSDNPPPSCSAEPDEEPHRNCDKEPSMETAPVTLNLPGGAQIVDLVADLMTADDSLCHCVSVCLGMGKGIAVLFKERFGGIDELRAQNPTVGGVCVLRREGRCVYYLFTKPKYSDKPTYESLASSLRAMFSHMLANGIPSVSMPEIGCGARWAALAHSARHVGNAPHRHTSSGANFPLQACKGCRGPRDKSASGDAHSLVFRDTFERK